MIVWRWIKIGVKSVAALFATVRSLHRAIVLEG
jgi:hypothetical protein